MTRAADLWLLDRHRLLCGDPLDLTTLDRMLHDERLVFIAFDPTQCDRIAHRFRQLTGHDATLAVTGQSFTEVAEQRGVPATATRASLHRHAPPTGPAVGRPDDRLRRGTR